ncbi:hypothetical protein OC834_004348 [Tilletia horrida]|nr:hypothetical protein OC834_004348 [Tilletia horrida]
MASSIPSSTSTFLRAVSRPRASAIAGPSSSSLPGLNHQRAAASTVSPRNDHNINNNSGQPRKRRVVILGSGWGGYSLASALDKKKNDVYIVSPSTNFAFTPLLASVCVGALDYRAAIEPVREIKEANFLHSWVDAVDVKNRTVTLVPAYPRSLDAEHRFALTRGGFATALVRPAHRRPVETAENDASNPVNSPPPQPPHAVTLASIRQTAGTPSNGAFQPSSATSARPVDAAASSAAQAAAEAGAGAGADGALSSTGISGNHTEALRQLPSHNSYGPSETWASQERGREFKVDYDVLVVAVGSFNRTFKLKGVKSNAWFLRDIANARSIRFRLLECLEQASAPHLNDTERSRLLQWVIVGGGPTGAELAAELVDLREDLKRLYPKLAPLIKITLIDSAPAILNTFHDRLASYARAKFARDGIDMRLSRTVKEVRPGRIIVEEDGEIPFSILVWSTGLCANPLIKKLAGQSAKPEVNGLGDDAEAQGWGSMAFHERTTQLLIDDHLRVLAPLSKPDASEVQGAEAEQSVEEVELGKPSERSEPKVLPGVFAIGDSAALQSGILPATAQVAAQQAKHLAKLINNLPPVVPSPTADVSSSSSSSRGGGGGGGAKQHDDDVGLAHITRGPKFAFHNRGIMASLGSGRAIVQFPPMPANSKTERDLSGRPAWLAWRSAYTMMSLSWRNKVAVPLNWLMTGVFGRDISRF